MNNDIRIGIHPVHRRLAELHFIQQKRSWVPEEQLELMHCIQVNAILVKRLDELHNLAYVAHCSGDMNWVQDIQGRIDQVARPMMEF